MAFISLVIVFTLAGMLVFGQRGMIHVRTLQQQFAALETENQRLARENVQLRKEIELLQENLTYIEDIARKHLGLVKKGELVYQLRPNDSEESGEESR